MYLSDTKIQELIDSKVLLNADASNIGQVTYDLRTEGFYINESKQSEVELGPGDSTFVSCVECVALPNDLTASVLLRNSRIRQGLSLDAPLYFPGHGTRLFYRVTNVSGSTITLDKSKASPRLPFSTLTAWWPILTTALSLMSSTLTDLQIIPTSMPENSKRSRIKRKKSRISSPVFMAMSWPSSPFLPRSLRS